MHKNHQTAKICTSLTLMGHGAASESQKQEVVVVVGPSRSGIAGGCVDTEQNFTDTEEQHIQRDLLPWCPGCWGVGGDWLPSSDPSTSLITLR